MQHPCKLLRNAADVHSSPLCLMPCRTRSSWLQTRGHLHDTPDFERVIVWTVYEMASFRRELGIPPTLSRVPAGRAHWRILWRRQPDARGERILSYFSGLFSLIIKSAVPTTHHRAWVLLHCYCREGGCLQRQRGTVRKLLNEPSILRYFSSTR